jgi:hypothetical protein
MPDIRLVLIFMSDFTPKPLEVLASDLREQEFAVAGLATGVIRTALSAAGASGRS